MRRVLLAVAFVVAGSSSTWSAEPSAVGSWRTIDDATGRERSVVRIVEQGGVLTGRVVSTVDPADARRLCDLCDDDRKGQPLIGLEIMRGMRADGDGWSGGRVLDPQTGSVYRGEIHLIDNGARLVLRGYIGISLFGRSQTWIRVVP